jgi:DNA (cytosine-5)-methyltransferase 1
VAGRSGKAVNPISGKGCADSKRLIFCGARGFMVVSVTDIQPLYHFSLFSGIGGIDLAAEWAGFTTVGQCELADYPTKILEKHWPNVPRWRDIRDVTAESVRKAGIRTIDLISGGFSCQPYSLAGKRKGAADDRYIWPEMRRVINELKPSWVLGENVAGIIYLGLDQVLSDLENMGYEFPRAIDKTPIVFDIPACAVNAEHIRHRIWILAHSNEQRCFSGQNETRMAYKTSARRPEKGSWMLRGFRGRSGRIWQAPESSFERVDYGIPSELDRLRALGNAVDPRQVYPILKAIADVEAMLRNQAKV